MFGSDYAIILEIRECNYEFKFKQIEEFLSLIKKHDTFYLELNNIIEFYYSLEDKPMYFHIYLFFKKSKLVLISTETCLSYLVPNSVYFERFLAKSLFIEYEKNRLKNSIKNI